MVAGDAGGVQYVTNIIMSVLHVQRKIGCLVHIVV